MMDFFRSNWLLLAVLSAFFAALTTIFAKIGVRDVPSNLATAIRTVVILLLAWGIVLATGEVTGLGSVTQRSWLFLILSGVMTGLSWIFYFAALQKGPASVVAPIDKTSLAMVLVLAALFLGEPLTWKTALGGGLVVLGAIVVAWR
jgi:transporter family protein